MHTLVILSGGFHPFHAGHMALYNAAKRAFPGADVVVGATNVTKDRPFPFKIKQKLAQVAGVDPGHFVEVNRQFSAEPENIAKRIKDPEDTILIFVRSDKDKRTHPLPARPDLKTGKLPLKKDGTPVSDYLLDYAGNERNLQPLTKHAYMAYLPTVEFGGGLTSASEIRNKWPSFTPQQKAGLVTNMYPVTKNNPALAQNVVKMLDAAIGSAPPPAPAVKPKTAAIDRIKANPLREDVLTFIREGRPLLKEATVEQRFRYLELLKESAFVMSTVMPLVIQLMKLLTPKTRQQALKFMETVRNKYGVPFSIKVYKMAQHLLKLSKDSSDSSVDQSLIENDDILKQLIAKEKEASKYPSYKLSNGQELRYLSKVRVPAAVAYAIPEEDIIKYGLELDHDAVSPSPVNGKAQSEVIIRTKTGEE